MEWIFDGIGTMIVSGILGLLFGGVIGYRIGVRISIRQKQKGGDNANQSQIGINHGCK